MSKRRHRSPARAAASEVEVRPPVPVDRPPAAPTERRPRDVARLVTLLGVALIGLGMVAVVSGIVVSSLFRPGTFMIGLGLLTTAAAGVLAVLPRRA